MAGLLGFHLEDAEGTGGRVVDDAPGALDESETATAEIADLQQEDAERVTAEAEADDLEERVDLAEELHDEVEPVVTEGAGYDTAGMALLLVGMRRVAGRHGKHLVGKDVKMEAISAGVSGRKEQTRIQFESLKDTLKQAWEAIKQAFKKAWAKVKTWYIKTFDASKKLKARATKVRDRAEGMSATIDKKSFTFSGIKTLGKGGKIGDAGDVKSGMDTLKTLSDELLDVQSTNTLDSKIDTFTSAISGFGKGDSEDLNKVKGLISAIETAVGTKSVSGTSKPGEVDAKIITGLGGDENTYKFSAVLPGDKVIIHVSGKRGNTNTVENELACVRRTRLTFSNVKDKPKEVASGAEAKTANSSQISSICQAVITIAENIFDFKKGWEGRDSHQAKVIKEIDDQFRDINKDLNDDETENGGKKARNARSVASAATGLIRRDSSFKASFVGYLMNTSNVALSYCERSIANHK